MPHNSRLTETAGAVSFPDARQSPRDHFPTPQHHVAVSHILSQILARSAGIAALRDGLSRRLRKPVETANNCSNLLTNGGLRRYPYLRPVSTYFIVAQWISSALAAAHPSFSTACCVRIRLIIGFDRSLFPPKLASIHVDKAVVAEIEVGSTTDVYEVVDAVDAKRF